MIDPIPFCPVRAKVRGRWRKCGYSGQCLNSKDERCTANNWLPKPSNSKNGGSADRQ